MNKDFNIYNKAKLYYEYIRKYIIYNIPKIRNDLRIHFNDESYNLIKNIFGAYYNMGNIRKKYIQDILINISMLDFLTSDLINLNCINSNKIDTSIKYLVDIKNMTYAWKNNEEKNM